MNYYIEIKYKLLSNEVLKKAKDYSKNTSDLQTYFDVGKILVEAQGGEERAKYGDGLINEYSKKLTFELDKKFVPTLLKNIRKFYLLMKKGPMISDQLTWSHYVELLKFDDISRVNYYIGISIKQNLSVRELRHKIKNNEYERLKEATKNKLKEKEETKVINI